MVYLVPIAEGHGEVAAVPELLRRIARRFGDVPLVNPPIRVISGSFLRDESYFRRYVELAAAKAAQRAGCVVIILDCEDDCPGTIGPHLLRRAQSVRSDVPILVALAYREFESWFLAAARSLSGQHGLAPNLEPPPNAEALRDAKGWLNARMNRRYDEVVHQLEFAKAMDLDEARTNASFDRLYERIGRHVASA